MQFNPGMKTIEGELMGAMAKAGAVSEANAGQFGKVIWLLQSTSTQDPLFFACFFNSVVASACAQS